MSKISVKLDYLQQDINKLRQEIPESQGICEKRSNYDDEWQEMFPLKSVEEVNNLERLLEIKEKRSNLVRYIFVVENMILHTSFNIFEVNFIIIK